VCVCGNLLHDRVQCEVFVAVLEIAGCVSL